MTDNLNKLIVWNAPNIIKPEFRLYYDDNGNVVCYTCEKLEGNYIVIDSITFAEARPDVRVIDNRIVRVNSGSVISKLQPNELNGVTCEQEDVSIITESQGQRWQLKTRYV
jgi:hypothetical protein